MNPPSPSYSLTGGARIGWMNCSWPLATLNVTADRLTISTTMFGLFSLGTYSFAKDQILSMESYGSIPLLGQGIRITHSVAEYPRRIIFWGNPQKILAGIAAVGFVPVPPSGPPRLPLAGPSAGIPIRWTPVILLVAIWNGLYLYGFSKGSVLQNMHPALPILLPVALFFTIAITTLFSPVVQKALMKPGRHFGEVRHVFLLIAFITGIMTAALGSILVVSALSPAHPKPVGAPDPPAASGR